MTEHLHSAFESERASARASVWDRIWRDRGESDYEVAYRTILERHGGLAAGEWALEAGAGSGRALLGACGTTGAIPLALDFSPVAIEGLAVDVRRVGGAAVMGDLRHLPFRSGSIPCVFNSGVIEHLRPPQDAEALAQMARVTRKGGTIVVLVPNRCCPWFMLAKGLLKLTGRWRYGYERSYTPWGLSTLARNAGLEVTRRVGAQVLPPSQDGFRRYCGPVVAAWLRRAEKRLIGIAPYVGMATGVVVRK